MELRDEKKCITDRIIDVGWRFLSADALAARTVETVSKAQFGSQWAFVKEEVQLQCTKIRHCLSSMQARWRSIL